MRWGIHPDYPIYEISEYGDVRKLTESPTRKKGSRPRGTIDHDGYLRYKLISHDGEKRNVAAHKLVIETFVGYSPDNSHEVAHNNGSRVYHHFSNLRWALPIENHADRVNHNTDAKGEQNGRAMLNEDAVVAIRKERRDGNLSGARVKYWANEFGVGVGAIYDAAKRKTWSHVK